MYKIAMIVPKYKSKEELEKERKIKHEENILSVISEFFTVLPVNLKLGKSSTLI
jgi:hypothetical protein